MVFNDDVQHVVRKYARVLHIGIFSALRISLANREHMGLFPALYAHLGTVPKCAIYLNSSCNNGYIFGDKERTCWIIV